MEATLKSMYADYHERGSADVSDMTAEISQILQRATLTDGLFPDTDLVGLQSDVSAWLGAETEAEIVADMVDMAIGGEESEEEEYRDSSLVCANHTQRSCLYTQPMSHGRTSSAS
ncbi:hypothetical protein I4F81_007953 [Pyropia yezoensis]|uniref:Uncharacterized protein n=1 Tax=Pyropia yezoensis TaxID=2788 RepID=A0ACC3C6I7_PYRYE|nr:hypothetical protein I4F81_007953 [Neopyropia yezoensis]